MHGRPAADNRALLITLQLTRTVCNRCTPLRMRSGTIDTLPGGVKRAGGMPGPACRRERGSGVAGGLDLGQLSLVPVLQQAQADRQQGGSEEDTDESEGEGAAEHAEQHEHE